MEITDQDRRRILDMDRGDLQTFAFALFGAADAHLKDSLMRIVLDVALETASFNRWVDNDTTHNQKACHVRP